VRNTVREVVPIRLGAAERAQIARAAGRLKLPLSGFIRQASLQASAVVEGKVSARVPERPEVVPARGGVVLDLEPRPHHFVDGLCVGCGLDVDDVRGRDLPCREGVG
jgi:hypothetical protein